MKVFYLALVILLLIATRSRAEPLERVKARFGRKRIYKDGGLRAHHLPGPNVNTKVDIIYLIRRYL